MKHFIKRTAYTFFFMLIGLITLVYIVLNNNSFQNWLTGRVTQYLSNRFKTNISIGHISYRAFTSISMDEVYFGDQKNDTLFYVEELKFNLGGFDYDSLRLSLHDVKVKGGYCKLVTYPDHTFNIDVLFNILDPNDTIADPLAKPFALYFDKVTATGMRFRYVDYTKKFGPEGFDGFNQDFYDATISAKNFWIIEDSLHLQVDKLTCKERSGLEVKNLKCMATIAPSCMRFDQMEVNTAHSHLSNSYTMEYDGWGAFSDYYDKVTMTAAMEDATVDMRDLACFAPLLKDKRQVFVVNGKMRGPLNNLKFKEVELSFGATSHFAGNVNLRGLPEIEETFIDANTKDALTTRADLEYLLGDLLPDELSRLGKMKFQGRYTGFYNDFVAFGHFNTSLGEIESDLNMKLLKVNDAAYSGNLQLIDFDLGSLAGIRQHMGRTSLSVSLQGEGFAMKNHRSTFKSTIAYLQANGYDYHNIAINGRLDKRIFEGKLNMNDPNARVAFQGSIDLRSNVQRYRFEADIQKADLMALKLVNTPAVFSSGIHINFDFKNIDNNNGSIVFNNILFRKEAAEYPLRELQILSRSEGSDKQISVKSEILEAEMRGDYSLSDMEGNITAMLNAVFPDYVAPVRQKLKKEEFTYKLKIMNSDWLSDIFMPSFRVYGLNVEGSISSSRNQGSLHAIASSVKYNSFTVENLVLKTELFNSTGGKVLLGVGELLHEDSVMMKDFALKADLAVNKADVAIKVADTTGLFYADVETAIDFLPQRMIKFGFPGYNEIGYRKKIFSIADSGTSYCTDSQVFCSNIVLRNGDSRILLSGFYDFNDLHNIKAEAKNVDMALVNFFVPDLSVAVGGRMTGEFVLKGNKAKSYLTSSATLRSLTVSSDTLGDFSVTSQYNEYQKRILLYARSLDSRLKNFEMGGYVSTGADEELNIDVFLDETDVSAIQPFIKDHIHFYSGIMAGKCKISGTLKKKILSGDFSVRNADIRVEYLKTRYKFNLEATVDNDAVRLKPCILSDEFGKTGVVTGVIRHHNLSDFQLDIAATKLDHFQVLNTTARDNSLFYGSAYASGSVFVTGPATQVLLETDLKTEKGTTIYIPFANSESAGEGFINFINRDTSIKEFIAKKSDLPGFELSSVIQVTKEAEILLILNEQTGDIMRGRGTGNIKMELTKEGAFNMYGQVSIEQGEYRFTAANVFSKKFTLLKGGAISWTGNPMQARLDIQGMYTVRKTSIAELVQDATAESKVPVECLLFVRGNLSAPDIRFDLNFPDMQNTVGSNNSSQIQNVLRTLRAEPDMMNQQVMSLMLFGKFVPLNANNTASSSNLQSGTLTTLSDMFTAQANNLIGNIIPGLDFNVDYQAATQSGKSRAIFSASKKFYDNRLEVQTSYDPVTAAGATNAANLASVTTQYNIWKDGNLKIKAYSRNTTDPIYNGRNALTQGVGLYYRKEFDSFVELLGRKKVTK